MKARVQGKRWLKDRFLEDAFDFEWTPFYFFVGAATTMTRPSLGAKLDWENSVVVVSSFKRGKVREQK